MIAVSSMTLDLSTLATVFGPGPPALRSLALSGLFDLSASSSLELGEVRLVVSCADLTSLINGICSAASYTLTAQVLPSLVRLSGHVSATDGGATVAWNDVWVTCEPDGSGDGSNPSPPPSAAALERQACHLRRAGDAEQLAGAVAEGLADRPRTIAVVLANNITLPDTWVPVG